MSKGQRCSVGRHQRVKLECPAPDGRKVDVVSGVGFRPSLDFYDNRQGILPTNPTRLFQRAMEMEEEGVLGT